MLNPVTARTQGRIVELLVNHPLKPQPVWRSVWGVERLDSPFPEIVNPDELAQWKFFQDDQTGLVWASKAGGGWVARQVEMDWNPRRVSHGGLSSAGQRGGERSAHMRALHAAHRSV